MGHLARGVAQPVTPPFRFSLAVIFLGVDFIDHLVSVGGLVMIIVMMVVVFLGRAGDLVRVDLVIAMVSMMAVSMAIMVIVMVVLVMMAMMLAMVAMVAVMNIMSVSVVLWLLVIVHLHILLVMVLLVSGLREHDHHAQQDNGKRDNGGTIVELLRGEPKRVKI